MRYFCCVFCGIPHQNYDDNCNVCGPGSSVGIATELRAGRPGIESRWGKIFRRTDQPLGPPSLLYNGYQVLPVGKVRPGRAADHSPPSSAKVRKSRTIPLPTLWATPRPLRCFFTFIMCVCVCVYIQYS